MSKEKANPYLGSDIKSLIAEQVKNEEFVEAFELERELLKIAHKASPTGITESSFR